MSLDIDFEFTDDESSVDIVEPNIDSYRRRVVDLSGSMGVTRRGRRPVDELNAQMENWLPKVREKGIDELRNVEFAIVTFGSSSVGLHTPTRTIALGEGDEVEPWMSEDDGVFMPAASLQANGFTASGMTPMISALRVALALGDQRAKFLGDQGVSTGQVRLILFTDGSPTDRSLTRDAWRDMADELAKRRTDSRNQTFAFGVPGSDARKLRALVGENGFFPLEGFDFARLLELILIATSADSDPYDALWDALNGPDDGAAGEHGDGPGAAREPAAT
jgi:uncharacterized protein YegL